MVSKMKFEPIERITQIDAKRLGLQLDIENDWPVTSTAIMKTNELVITGDNDGYMCIENNRISPSCMMDISKMIGYPHTFVMSMPMNIRLQIIAECIERFRNDRDRQVQFVARGKRIVSFCNGRRPILNDIDILAQCFEFLYDAFGDRIKIDHIDIGDELLVRFVTPFAGRVTPAEGDVLQAYVEVRYSFSGGLSVSLFVKRLICTNGMTANEKLFSWRSGDISQSEQLEWLAVTCGEVLGTFPDLIERAKIMSSTLVRQGADVDVMRTALMARLTAMEIPRKYHETVYNNWLEEPGNTEWDMLNAVTRAGTHSPDIPDNVKSTLCRSGGQWVASFNFTNARLSLPLAKSIGAEILDES